MHAIHTTPGFIIGSRPYGDAGRILTIFTRDFGLIFATAQGIRLEKSKLRYYTQEYSFGTYSLVRGREFWRVTSANGGIQQLGNMPILYLNARGLEGGGEELIARIALLLRRLLQGEESHPELFDIVFECWKFLKGHSIVESIEMPVRMEGNPIEMQVLESLVVARIMFALGYIGEVAGLADQLKLTEITHELLSGLGGQRTTLNSHINKALKESML